MRRCDRRVSLLSRLACLLAAFLAADASSVFAQTPGAGAAKLTTAQAQPASYFEVSFDAQAGVPYRLWVRLRAQNNDWVNDSVFVQFSDTVDSASSPIYALAAPDSYVEMTFQAEANMPYRLWLRMKAQNNHWSNDSVHVQFSDSLSPAGSAAWRIGTTQSTEVNLEDCGGCGLSGWGWQDNGYGAGVMGPIVTFETSGVHTIRIQARDDGASIDPIVLSPQGYLNTPPGALKNDATILIRP